MTTITTPGPDALLTDMAALVRGCDDWLADDPAPRFDAFAAVPPPMPPRPASGPASPVGAAPSRDPEARARAAAGALRAVDALQPRLNAFTTVFTDELRAAAETVGVESGPLAGVPVAVKDLFDIAGTVTLAGSAMRLGAAPAATDATVVRRLREAGALLVGATNMDEFAYGFTTENSHFGPTRNPHDPARVAGGSSGGSAAAVAAGIVRIALGTDTNGSVRIPAAFCGIYGLRPTYGLLPRTGAFPFVPGLDAVGPLARTPADIALALDVLAGPDGVDPTCVAAAASYTSALERGISGLRVVRGSGDLWAGGEDAVVAAADEVAAALGAQAELTIPDVGRARGAAIVLTAAEGAAQHRAALLATPEAFDPRVRGRFLAGLGVPAIDYVDMQRFRRWWQRQVLALLAGTDVLVVPTVACTAPLIDQPTVPWHGVPLPTGAVLGRFTQPLSFLGLPCLSVPVVRAGALPVGVQLVARPGEDAVLLAAAAHLHRTGITGCGTPALSVETLQEVA
jgi:amidase/aspartyl-tRNA(Asn)/glutamyl-tRNA(Gln) amidotransferase subunit A